MYTPKINDRAAPTIEVYDGEVSLGLATVTGDTWELKPSTPLDLAVHVFHAKSGAAASNPHTVTVIDADDGLNLIRPHVREATTVSGDIERLNYYNVMGPIQIIVPDYNIEAGDTVQVIWEGQRKVSQTGEEEYARERVELQPRVLGTPPQLAPFIMSKYEVINVIGGDADIWYTVKRTASGTTHSSIKLKLTVDDHAFTLSAPTINSGHDNLRIWRQSQFNDLSTADIRGIAGDGELDLWLGKSEAFGTRDYINFPIDPAWFTRNRGKPVKFNWSLRLKPEDGTSYYFSQLLRVDTL